MDRCECQDHHHLSEPLHQRRRDDGPQEPEDDAGTSSRPSLTGRWARFFLWWLIFSGIYASSSVCPFCGQAGCPVGAASAGVVGGVFAFLITAARRLWTSLKGILPPRRST